MSFVAGYRGQQQINRNFVDNPLAVMPSTHIVVTDREVAMVLGQTNWPDWSLLNPQQKSQITREVLLMRGDATSLRQAEQLGLNIPIYSQIQMITTPDVPSQSDSVLSHFLL